MKDKNITKIFQKIIIKFIKICKICKKKKKNREEKKKKCIADTKFKE